MTKKITIVLLGSCGVGKSAIASQFVQNIFIQTYTPTIEDIYQKILDIGYKKYILEIIDSSGKEQFSAIQDLYMQQGNGFLLVFSLLDKSSFTYLSDFYDKLSLYNPRPILLVGNKNDLSSHRQVYHKDALQLSKSWKCKYIETSAKNPIEIKHIFISLVQQILHSDSPIKSKSSRKCIIL